MKYAIVNNTKIEAKKGLYGSCPNCGKPVISKCGEKKIHHWSHKGKIECDPWKENETEWHRTWKDYFPVDNQEVIHRDETTGERHIADVKTNDGIVIEFQHSPIKPEERKSRNDFYKRIIWVVNGRRLKKDETNFEKAYNSGAGIGHVKKIHTGDSSLINEWSGMSIPIFLDFSQSVLWLLIPIVSNSTTAYIFPISKVDFLEIFREMNSQKKEVFWKFLNDFIILIKDPRQIQINYVSSLQRSFIHRGARIDLIQNKKHRRRRCL